MNSAIITVMFLLVGFLVLRTTYRVGRYLVRLISARLPARKQPPTLMRVGEVTAKPPEPTRAAPVLTEVTDTGVPPAPAPYQAQKSSTQLFSVDLLQDRSAAANPMDVVDPADTPLADGSDYAFGPALTPFLSAALPDSAERKKELKTDLIRAGYYQPHAFENIQAIRWVFLTAPLFFLAVMINVLPRGLEMWAIGTMLAVATLGWALPKVYIASQARDRRSEIERSLPDVLDMLNMCVSQGMTLIVALKRVTKELRTVFPALSQELQIVAEQAELGTLEQALTNFSRRVEAPDVHSFTSLLIQTERMGTSVSVALGDYAENMRESLRQRADEKANKATFQLLFPTVLFLMPSVYIFLLGPSIIKLTDFFSGNLTPPPAL